MVNTLAAPTDLTAFPGAPFTDAIVDAAVGSVRREAGWHIAPAVTETLTVDSRGGRWLMLPTMSLTAVTAVRDVSGDTPETLTGWKFKRAGMLYRATGWKCDAVIEADVTHGYTSTPAELYSVIAERCQAFTLNKTIAQEAKGPFSTSSTNLSTLATWLDGNAVMAQFTIPAKP